MNATRAKHSDVTLTNVVKYEAEIDGRHLVIDLEERNGRVSAVVDQQRYDVAVVRPEEGVYLIFAGPDVYEIKVWSAAEGSLAVNVRGRQFGASIVDRKHRRLAAEHRLEGRQALTSPMPGKIVKILLEAGADVAAGQGIVVVEAMKMQNEIKSPKSGRLVDIRVNEGQLVNANQILAVVE